MKVDDVMGNEPDRKLYVERTIKCRDCGEEFVWTVGEQEFYAQKEFVPPVRCKKCRQLKKQRRDKR